MYGGDDMRGIDLNGEISYKTSSLRFFEKNECHVTRTCPHDVLLLVYEGILRFSEDGEEYELHPGDYFIQRFRSDQTGEKPSDSPKYLYIHFFGEWDFFMLRSCGAALPLSGIVPNRRDFL